MNSYKAIYRYLLAFAVLFLSLPATTMALDTLSLPLLQENYLEQKLNRKLNQALSMALEGCLTNKRDDVFMRQFYNIAGDLVQIEQSCHQLIDDVLRKPIRDHYTQMRVDLALSRPAFREDNVLLTEYGNDHALKLKTNAQHPLANILSEVKIAQLNPLTKEEMVLALNDYNRFRDDACSKAFLTKELSIDQKQQALKLCHRLANENFKSVKAPSAFDDNATLQTGLLKGIESHLRAARFEFHREKLNSYIRTITRSPLLVLVHSANPTNEELLRVVREQSTYAGPLTRQVDSINKSYKVSEKRLVDLATMTGGISESALEKVKKNFPEIADWDTVFMQENDKIKKIIQRKSDDHALDVMIISGSCLLVAKGPWAAACGAFLIALTTATDYSIYNSQLLDVLTRIDKNLEQKDFTADSLLEKLEQAETTSLVNLLTVLPALKAASRIDTIRILDKVLNIKTHP